MTLLFTSIHVYHFWKNKFDGNYIVFVIVSIFIVSFTAILPKITYLEIDDKNLTCKALFVIKKTIPISSIVQIETCNYIYAGLKFTTSLNGMILRYNRYDEILIGPKLEKEFIAELTKRNSAINIKINN